MADVVEVLTLTGTKVEAVHEFGVPGLANGNAAGYRVGRVLSFEQHPNADRLRLCRVDVGDGEPRQIVCGASNFAEGDTVALEVVSRGELTKGRLYDQQYHVAMRFRGGKIVSTREYLDTHHVVDIWFANNSQAKQN